MNDDTRRIVHFLVDSLRNGLTSGVNRSPNLTSAGPSGVCPRLRVWACQSGSYRFIPVHRERLPCIRALAGGTLPGVLVYEPAQRAYNNNNNDRENNARRKTQQAGVPKTRLGSRGGDLRM
jgi:hypothetical protein